ncbi:MAG TPA: ABC transporter substrate-binding protein [Rhizomicrobium sp.]|jgi:iron(III) transport system substrate-binding protein
MHADAAVSDLLAHFHQRYPFIEIHNSDGDGAKTYRRFVREVSSGKPTADFIWSSAMDLQEKLINDGFSLAYASPEVSSLPGWAHWQDLGYGVTLEPIAFVYNRRYLGSWEMPRTHVGLNAMLSRQAKRFQSRVAAYDPEKSEVGMLLLSQDIRVTRDSWNLFDTLGAVDAQLYSTSRDMLINILNGNQWIGYDVIASYAVEMQKTHPELAVVYPTDYVLDLSRVAFVTARAQHPNTAKLFLDYLLSREGQSILKSHGMGPVRTDLTVPKEQSRIDPIRTQAIRIGPGLLSDLDSLVRAQFLRRWRQARIMPD